MDKKSVSFIARIHHSNNTVSVPKRYLDDGTINGDYVHVTLRNAKVEVER